MAVRVELGSTASLYTYFILASAIGSVIFYTGSTEIRDLQFVDALFMACSAVTGTGLNVLDLSTLNSVQQGTLFTLLIVGHAIPILGVLSLIRAWTLRAELKEKSHKKRRDHLFVPKSTLLIEREKLSEDKEDASTVKITTLPKITTRVRELPEDSLSAEIDPCWNAHDSIIITNPTSSCQRPQAPSITILCVANIVLDTKTRVSRTLASLKHSIQRQAKCLSSRSSIDSDEPGWIEYRALLLVSVLVIFYFLTFLFLGIVIIGFWLAFAHPDIPRENRVPPFWTGVFLATSAFANNGMSLIDTSMGPFQREPYTLLFCGFLVLAGNALFPCLLRLSLWLLSRIVPDKPVWYLWRRVLDYILRQSQSVVCTLLYPTCHTWFLLGTVFILNGIMWGAFEVASLRSAEIGDLPVKYRALDGLFQALSVRGGGFSVVAIDRLPQGLLILYALMMYLSAFPVSAAISAETLQTQQETPCLETGASSRPLTSDSNRSILARGHFICQQIHAQFSTDLWWLSLAVMLISIAESDHYKSNPIAFSTFNIIFEVVSAYSSVGISVGFLGKSYAFCGEWHTVSKLLLIAISLRGRHRGLSVLPDSNPSLVDPAAGPTRVGVQEKISDTHKPE